jgi:hypothetical protein
VNFDIFDRHRLCTSDGRWYIRLHLRRELRS